MSEPAKSPCIRVGQRKPYAKATRQQIAERIHGASLLFFCGMNKSKIHRIFRERYGIEWRQTDRYLALARANGSRAPDQPLPSNQDAS